MEIKRICSNFETMNRIEQMRLSRERVQARHRDVHAAIPMNLVPRCFQWNHFLVRAGKLTPRGAWSLDTFGSCAVVADDVCDSHLPERRVENSPHLSPGGRFENSPPFQGWDCVANRQSPEGTVELFTGDPLS